MLVPVMSAGIRSGVNWTRLNDQVERFADGAHQQRLAQAGDAFEQGVAARQQAGQDAAHDLGLADDDLADLGLDRARGLDEPIRRGPLGGVVGRSRRNVGWQNGHF